MNNEMTCSTCPFMARLYGRQDSVHADEVIAFECIADVERIVRVNPDDCANDYGCVRSTNLASRWERVCGISCENPSIAALLRGSTAVSDDGEHLVFSVPAGFTAAMLCRADIVERVNAYIGRVFGPRKYTAVSTADDQPMVMTI